MQSIESPVAEADLRSKIKFETLNKLSQNGRSSFLVSILNGGLVYFTLLEVGELIVLNLWLATLVLVSFCRLGMVFWFWNLSEGHKRLNFWTALYLILIYVSAACWGVLPLWNVFAIADWTQSLIIFVVAGMSAGGLVSLYPMLIAAIPYLLIVLSPLIYVLAVSGEPAHTTMAVLTCLFLILVVRSTYTLNASAMRSIQLEMENSELFQFLLQARK